MEISDRSLRIDRRKSAKASVKRLRKRSNTSYGKLPVAIHQPCRISSSSLEETTNQLSKMHQSSCSMLCFCQMMACPPDQLEDLAAFSPHKVVLQSQNLLLAVLICSRLRFNRPSAIIFEFEFAKKFPPQLRVLSYDNETFYLLHIELQSSSTHTKISV